MNHLDDASSDTERLSDVDAAMERNTRIRFFSAGFSCGVFLSSLLVWGAVLL